MVLRITDWSKNGFFNSAIHWEIRKKCGMLHFLYMYEDETYTLKGIWPKHKKQHKFEVNVHNGTPQTKTGAFFEHCAPIKGSRLHNCIYKLLNRVY